MQTHTESTGTYEKKLSLRKFFWAIVSLCAIGLLSGGYYFYSLTGSPSFPQGGAILHISRGMNVEQIAQEAQTAGIVKSSFLLYAVLTFSYDPTKIYAGTYHFEVPHNVFQVAEKLASSDVDQTLTRITIPEGMTRKEIARIAAAKLTEFDTTKFLEITKNNEGYLFPETYFVPETYSAEEFVTLLTETYASSVSMYKDEIANSDFSEYEILILASILEREANNEESMRMVSSILQNRLKIGMALQTDASIGYVLDKPITDLQSSDLEFDTPYNTYLYPGLVPTPIGNPGLLAIDAVLHPTESGYLYYITGSDGTFHYAKTFEEHKRNIANYLK